MVHTQDSSELAFGPSLALAPKHSGANKCLVGKKKPKKKKKKNFKEKKKKKGKQFIVVL